MIPNNIIEEEIKELITEKFPSISREHITSTETEYSKIIASIPYQFLAHIIRTMEIYAQKKLNCPFFRITCSPIEIKDVAKGLASGQYYENSSFDIVYDSKSDEIQTRVAISHELGHLFLILLHTQGNAAEDLRTEPLSTLFGIITMVHKRIDNNGKKKKCHKSDKDIVEDFSLLVNRNKGKFNIS